MSFHGITTAQLEARQRRLSEQFDRACVDRKLGAASATHETLNEISVELRRRESFALGQVAFASGLPLSENPHRTEPRKSAWADGWRDASNKGA